MTPQHPVRRKVALRPRRDAYTMPRFPETTGDASRYEPRDGGDWSMYGEDPVPFSWSDMDDARLWVGAAGALLGGVLVIAYWLTTGEQPR